MEEVGINTHNPLTHYTGSKKQCKSTSITKKWNKLVYYKQVHSNGVRLSLQIGNNIHYVSGGSQQHIWYRASTEIEDLTQVVADYL